MHPAPSHISERIPQFSTTSIVITVIIIYLKIELNFVLILRKYFSMCWILARFPVSWRWIPNFENPQCWASSKHFFPLPIRCFYWYVTQLNVRSRGNFPYKYSFGILCKLVLQWKFLSVSSATLLWSSLYTHSTLNFHCVSKETTYYYYQTSIELTACEAWMSVNGKISYAYCFAFLNFTSNLARFDHYTT
jgi:hypothetical protein